MAMKDKQEEQQEEEGMEQESQHPLELLKEDHQKVQELFSEFEEADTIMRHKLVSQAVAMLEVHTKLEEDLIYPAIREVGENEKMIDEAEEEHHVATLLIKELKKMKPKDERYVAKFLVLSELVKHHIEKEENETFPAAEQADIDWEEIGQEAMKMREKLMRKYKLEQRDAVVLPIYQAATN